MNTVNQLIKDRSSIDHFITHGSDKSTNCHAIIMIDRLDDLKNIGAIHQSEHRQNRISLDLTATKGNRLVGQR